MRHLRKWRFKGHLLGPKENTGFSHLFVDRMSQVAVSGLPLSMKAIPLAFVAVMAIAGSVRSQVMDTAASKGSPLGPVASPATPRILGKHPDGTPPPPVPPKPGLRRRVFFLLRALQKFFPFQTYRKTAKLLKQLPEGFFS